MNLCEIESSPNHREFYEKEAGTSLICVDESYLTCLLGAQILGNAGFYAGPTDDALNKQIQAENEVYEERHDPARRFQIWVLSRPLFSIGKLRHRMLNVIENTS